MKVLTLDIETTPALAWTFQVWNTNISPGQIVEPTRTLCFAAKWKHEKKVMFFSEWNGGHPNMIRQAHRLLDEADVVVTYNGDKFDLPHLNREFQEAGLTPPSPYHSVDLYKVIKKNQVYLSHKLGYITERLGLTGKMQNSGFPLWRRCVETFEFCGALDLPYDEKARAKALREMMRYDKQDVVTTEELLDAVLPYVSMPNPGLYTDEGTTLCKCGADDFQRRGWAYTKQSRYPRYRCNVCGSWFRGTRRDRGSDVA